MPCRVAPCTASRPPHEEEAEAWRSGLKEIERVLIVSVSVFLRAADGLKDAFERAVGDVQDASHQALA